MKYRFVHIFIALLSCISQVLGEVRPVIGLAILNDGTRVEAASGAYEYRELKFNAGTYQITFADGKKFAALAGQVRMRIDYREPPSQKSLQNMVDCSRVYQKSQPVLAPRIEKMRKDLEEMKLNADLAAIPAKKQSSVMLDKLNYKGHEYTNIRATSLQGGKFGFSHDSGGFAVPAMVINYALLHQIKKKSPEVADKLDFENLMGTFVEKLRVADKDLHGVRLIGKEKNLWIIQSNAGNYKVPPDSLSDVAKEKLESNYQQTERLVRRFDAAESREVAIQAAHIAQAELEEMRQARIKEKAIADHVAQIENEKQVREAALRKAETASRQRMQTGLGFLGAVIAAWLVADHFAPPQADGTDWNRVSTDVSTFCVRCSGAGGGYFDDGRGFSVFKDCPDCEGPRNF